MMKLKESCLPGDVLLSQGVATQVPSALKDLTSVFGMGTGVTPSPSSPDNEKYFVMVEVSGIEPLTSCLQGRRSPS